MQQTKMKKPKKLKPADDPLESISMAICPAREMMAYFAKKDFYQERGLRRMRVFPVWRRYREKAEKIARIQKYIPILKLLPMSFSEWLANRFF